MVAKAFEKKVGIYSGSFNPIHLGHLALANWLCEYTDLDEVWFLVTPLNPWKKEEGLMPDELRLKLVEKAMASYPKFKASDFEFHLPKPSYTIDTLHALSAAYPVCRFYLIIGSDNWIVFSDWKDYQTILAEYSLIVYPRKGYALEAVDPEIYPNVYLAESAPEIEISSTFIRDALANGKDIRFFLPSCIYEFLADYWSKK